MSPPVTAPYVAVIGPGDASPEQVEMARTVGRLVAESGAVVVCGGLGGVMEAVARGAAAVGGITVGVLPGTRRDEGNAFLTVALTTGLGEMRNPLVVRAADVVIAIGGAHGTLSEIALALRTGVVVVGIDTWDLAGVRPAAGPQEAVDLALAAVRPPTIYHCALSDNWAAALLSGEYRQSTRDRTLDEEGFIHAALASQLRKVADDFYRGRDDVVLLTIDTSRLGSELRVENRHGKPERYPHVYGPVPVDAVVAVTPLRCRADGTLELPGSLETTSPG